MKGTRDGDLVEPPPDSIYITTGPQKGFHRGRDSCCSRPEFAQVHRRRSPEYRFAVIDNSSGDRSPSDLWTGMWITSSEGLALIGTRTITDLKPGTSPEKPISATQNGFLLFKKKRPGRGQVVDNGGPRSQRSLPASIQESSECPLFLPFAVGLCRLAPGQKVEGSFAPTKGCCLSGTGRYTYAV